MLGRQAEDSIKKNSTDQLSGMAGGNGVVADAASDAQQWIPLLDYAVLKGVSTSTLRRYIKAKKIPYKIESGRYLLLAESTMARSHLNWDQAGVAESVSLFNKVRELENKLVRAQEQISELKMLVAIYEEKLAQIDH